MTGRQKYTLFATAHILIFILVGVLLFAMGTFRLFAAWLLVNVASGYGVMEWAERRWLR